MTCNDYKYPSGMTAIVKPTHDCPLSCKYCYVDENAKKGRMDLKTLENLIRKTMEFSGKERLTKFLWQGGEPLVMGLDFYKAVIDVQGTLSEYPVSNHIQTNAVLLTEGMIDYFVDNNFRLGISLDGPKEIQDAARVFCDGEGGSFDRTYPALMKVRERVKKDPKARGLSGGVIAVYSRVGMGKEKEIYDFFKKNSIPFQINTLLKSGNAKKNWEQLHLTPVESARGLIKFFDLWYNEPNYCIPISTFENLIGDLKTGSPSICKQGGRCQARYISFDPLGDAYPCTRFMGEPGFILGNINELTFKEINDHEIRKQMLSRKAQECDSCTYRKICNSGCPSNSYFEWGSFNVKDPHCAEYQILMNHIVECIKPELDSHQIKLEGIEHERQLQLV